MIFKQLARLEWKGFTRKSGMVQSILMGIGKGYFALCYLVIMVIMSFMLFELPDSENLEPLPGFFKFAIYLWLGDLIIRYFFQKMPTTLVKPLLVQNILKKTIVNYCLTKSSLSFFNFVNILMGIAVLGRMISLNTGSVSSILFALSFTLLLLANCFLVQLLDHVTKFALPFLVVFTTILALDFFKYIDATSYTKYFFETLYNYPFLLIVVSVYLILLLMACYRFYFKNLSLDSAIVTKKEIYKYYDLNFLNRFGTLAPFLKLDLKLLTRNKRTRTVLYMSLAFLLYGLFFLLNPSGAFEGSTFVILSGIMVTGGFMLMFGQYVPSWDSSYYPLMMTQNIPYRRYLESKWLIMVLGTLVSMILASFYMYFGRNVYLTIIAVGFYNIGWNCYLSLIIGAYVRTKIDLTSNKNAFGDTKAFNIKTMLLSIPTVLAPMIVYFILTTFLKFEIAIIVFIAIGLIGILLKKFMFDLIEKLYKKQKYTTLKAYK